MTSRCQRCSGRRGEAPRVQWRLPSDPGRFNARAPRVFDPAALITARLFAHQAAIALYGAQQAAALDQAVASRDVIGQAKGILIERHHVDAEQAFTMLVNASQDTNLKLRDVADWLVTEAAGIGC